MKRTILESIVREACRAPSGDNVQPWRFRWDGTALELYNVPNIHNPHLDFEERGAFIAHGALIENVLIVAPHYGYTALAEVALSEASNLVARISFRAREAYDDPLYAAVRVRATNHHPYENKPLTDQERIILEESVSPSLGVELKLVTDREGMRTLGRAASQVEEVILSNDDIASHFFSGMVWTHEEEQKKKGGFFVKTLEFNLVQSLVFWLASKPKMLRLFRLINLPRFIAHQDAHLYATGSVTGGVLVANESGEQFIAAGRALERVWLTATALGFGFQPLVGMVFVAYRVETGRGMLPTAQAARMREALAQTREALGGNGKIPAFLFRAGPAPAPSVRTSRREPDIEFV